LLKVSTGFLGQMTGTAAIDLRRERDLMRKGVSEPIACDVLAKKAIAFSIVLSNAQLTAVVFCFEWVLT
jgi:hypothetical protein